MNRLSLVELLHRIPAERAIAVARGELGSVWPGAAVDTVSLIFWRGVVWPLADVLRPPGRPDDPACNPRTDSA